MNIQNRIEISTLSNNYPNDYFQNNNNTKNNIEKSEIFNNLNNNNIYLKNDDSIYDNNISIETSKINLIKNPPNLLKLINSDGDDNIKIYNENIKLSSELTLEKCKVIKLNTLLKEKERENKELKSKIEELENNYEEFEINQKKHFEDKINSFYKDIYSEKNNLKETYDAIQRCKDKELLELNKEIDNIQNIINLFLNFYNKKIDILIKTGILPENKNKLIFLDNNYNTNYKNSLFIINSLDELINKLMNDNKVLYDELINYKDFIDKYENLNENEDKQSKTNEPQVINESKVKQINKNNNMNNSNNNKKIKNELTVDKNHKGKDVGESNDESSMYNKKNFNKGIKNKNIEEDNNYYKNNKLTEYNINDNNNNNNEYNYNYTSYKKGYSNKYNKNNNPNLENEKRINIYEYKMKNNIKQNNF